jgi:hypothetical protein
VVDEAVDHGGGYDVVAEGLAPAAEGQVRGDDDGALFVAAGDELEEQVRRVGVERDVADLVALCGHPHSSTTSRSNLSRDTEVSDHLRPACGASVVLNAARERPARCVDTPVVPWTGDARHRPTLRDAKPSRLTFGKTRCGTGEVLTGDRHCPTGSTISSPSWRARFAALSRPWQRSLVTTSVCSVGHQRRSVHDHVLRTGEVSRLRSKPWTP